MVELSRHNLNIIFEEFIEGWIGWKSLNLVEKLELFSGKKPLIGVENDWRKH